MKELLNWSLIFIVLQWPLGDCSAAGQHLYEKHRSRQKTIQSYFDLILIESFVFSIHPQTNYMNVKEKSSSAADGDSDEDSDTHQGVSILKNRPRAI